MSQKCQFFLQINVQIQCKSKWIFRGLYLEFWEAELKLQVNKTGPRIAKTDIILTTYQYLLWKKNRPISQEKKSQKRACKFGNSLYNRSGIATQFRQDGYSINDAGTVCYHTGGKVSPSSRTIHTLNSKWIRFKCEKQNFKTFRS